MISLKQSNGNFLAFFLCRMTILSLNRKIINQIEQKQEVFRGLRGLRVVELKKIVKGVESPH